MKEKFTGIKCFNRTFMELKRTNNIALVLRHLGFNRTFMELKQDGEIVEKVLVLF